MKERIALPESEARFVRLQLEAGQDARFYGLSEVVVQPLSFGATPNDFVRAVARDARRGTFPRGFHDEQPYWTIVGEMMPVFRPGSNQAGANVTCIA